MRKNLKTILLLLTIMTVICIFVGCGDGRKDDSASFPESNSESVEQPADAAGTDNGEDFYADKLLFIPKAI